MEAPSLRQGPAPVSHDERESRCVWGRPGDVRKVECNVRWSVFSDYLVDTSVQAFPNRAEEPDD